MQLVAYGAQDVYLTGTPQITFFKSVYRRHTNFAIECQDAILSGTAGFSNRQSANITRNGDLVTNMYLKVVVAGTPTSVGATAGNKLIKSVELKIGGSTIDKHYGHWMDVWGDLTVPEGKRKSYNNMLNAQTAANTANTASAATVTLYVPMQFFCNRNDGLALPLIALQYHDLKLDFEFDTAANAGITGGSPSISSTTLLVDYIYLDSAERKRFAQSAHEYLIEQVQHTSEAVTATTNKIRLNFNHPCKELIWKVTSASTTEAKLRLNGHDRMSAQSYVYFNDVQPWQHHTNGHVDDVCVYSFALNPEDHQPSGTCNFSRIDNAILHVTADGAGTVNVYAVNYNVLRIMSGMGGLAYSN